MKGSRIGSSWLRREVSEERRLIHQAWSLFRRNSLPLIGGSMIAGLIGAPLATLVLGLVLTVLGTQLTLFDAMVFAVFLVAIVPALGGLAGIITGRVRTGRRSRARDVLRGYRRFVALVSAAALFFAPVTLVTLVVQHFTMRPGPSLAVLQLLFMLPFLYLVATIVDQGSGIGRALLLSVRLLIAGSIVRTLVALVGLLPALLITMLPSTVAWLLLGLLLEAIIGPLTLVYVVCMYFRVRGESELLEKAVARTARSRSN